MADEETRPFRVCESCGGVDDHPRHRHEVAEGDGVVPEEIAQKALAAAGEHFAAVYADIMDTTTVVKHMDCCAADGCPSGDCDVVLQGAEDLKGDDLVVHVTSLPGTVTTVETVEED